MLRRLRLATNDVTVEYDVARSRVLLIQLGTSRAHTRTMTVREHCRRDQTIDVVEVTTLTDFVYFCWLGCAGCIVDLNDAEVKDGAPFHKLSNNLVCERMFNACSPSTHNGGARPCLPPDGDVRRHV